jgi:hypothetical protein
LLGPCTQNASKNDEFASIADADGLVVIAGDPAAEDEPMRKGTCLQVNTAVVQIIFIVVY